MARRRRGRRSYGGRRKRGRGRGKGGFLFGMRAMDIGQAAVNAQGLGLVGAVQSAARGDFVGAMERDLIPPMTNTGTMLNLAVKNVVIGVNRKILRAFGGKFVRRYIA